MTLPVDSRCDYGSQYGEIATGGDTVDRGPEFTCSLCGKQFRKKANLTLHLKTHEDGDKSDTGVNQPAGDGRDVENVCNVCNKKFSAKKNLLKHLRDVHKNFKEAENLVVKKIKCPETNCHFLCRMMKELRDHIESLHKIKILRDKLEFPNESDFLKWKKEEESNTTSWFISGRKKTVLTNGTIRQILHCHRTGQYIPRGCGKYRWKEDLRDRLEDWRPIVAKKEMGPDRFKKPESMRHEIAMITPAIEVFHLMRSVGSCKIGVTCPATMEVTESSDGQVTVIYYKTHLGHMQEVVHLKLTKEDRANLAEKIEQGFSLDSILEDVKEGVDSKNTKRIHLLSKKDLYSIMKSNGVNQGKKSKSSESGSKAEVGLPQPPQQQQQQHHPQHHHVQQQSLILENVQIEKCDKSIQQNFTLYPGQGVILPQGFADADAMPSAKVVLGEPGMTAAAAAATAGDGISPQIVILSRDLEYSPVAEIIVLSTGEGGPSSATLLPDGKLVSLADVGDEPGSDPNRTETLPRQDVSLEERNRLNRTNLRLQIKEKMDRIGELLPRSEYLTPKQFALVGAKLDAILNIFNEADAKARLKRESKRGGKKTATGKT